MGKKGSVREREKMLTMCKWELIPYNEFLGGILMIDVGKVRD